MLQNSFLSLGKITVFYTALNSHGKQSKKPVSGAEQEQNKSVVLQIHTFKYIQSEWGWSRPGTLLQEIDLSCTTVNAVNRLRVGLEVSCRLSVRRGSSSGGAKPARSMLLRARAQLSADVSWRTGGGSGGSTQGRSSPDC